MITLNTVDLLIQCFYRKVHVHDSWEQSLCIDKQLVRFVFSYKKAFCFYNNFATFEFDEMFL